MLLRNYYNALAYTAIGAKIYSEMYGTNKVEVKSVTDYVIPPTSVLTYAFLGLSVEMKVNDYDNSGTILGFGSGSTPVEYNDISLSTIIEKRQVSGSFVSCVLNYYDEETRKFSFTSKYVISNVDTLNSITIREFGIFRNYAGGRSNCAILYRSLLSAYTLEPSESANVLITFTYQMPAEGSNGVVLSSVGLDIE